MIDENCRYLFRFGYHCVNWDGHTSSLISQIDRYNSLLTQFDKNHDNFLLHLKKFRKVVGLF